MQHREWNPRSFFRHLTRDALTVYLLKHDLSVVLDGEGPFYDQFYRAWKKLPSELRLQHERNLLIVNDLCSEHARPYLDQLANSRWAGTNSTRLLESRFWTTNDLALRLFADAPQAVVQSHLRYAVDMMEHFKEYRGRRPVKLEPSTEAKTRMRAVMSKHFNDVLGSDKVQVEDFGDEEKLALFIYHEGELAPEDRFDGAGVLVPAWQRPVVRVATVFFRASRTLLVKAPREAERKRLRQWFSEIFVGEPDYFEDASRQPKFSFDPLLRKGFRFPVRPEDKILGVDVARVFVRGGHQNVTRAGLELMRDTWAEQLRDALEFHRLPIDPEVIVGVQLRFRFSAERGNVRTRTISLSNPNLSNLRDTPRDRVIRRYLLEWGIDVRRNTGNSVEVPAPQAAGF